MMNKQRMHPGAIAVLFLSRIREFIVPLIIAIFFGGIGTERISGPFLASLVLVFFVIHSFFYWFTYQFSIEEGELRIRRGLIIRKNRFIRHERIQSIDIVAGFWQQLLGLVKVRVETAGGGKEPEVNIIAVTKDSARRLRNELLQKPAAEEGDGSSIDGAVNSNIDVCWQVTTKELLLAALTSSGVGITLSALVAILSQMDRFLPEAWFDTTVAILTEMSTYALALIAVFIFGLAWIISIASMMLKYSKFRVMKRDQELEISRGLLEKRHLTLAIDRITSIRIVKTPIRQLFGYATVYIESAGGGSSEEQLSTVLFPLIKVGKLNDALRSVVPTFSFKREFQGVPRRALRRYVIRLVLIPLLVVAAFMWLVPYSYYVLFLFPLVVLFAYIQYRDAGLGCNDSFVWLRFRTWSQTEVIVPRSRIQIVEQRQSFMQRLHQLATCSVTVLTSITAKSFAVVDLEEKDCQRLQDWFSYEKRATKCRS